MPIGPAELPLLLAGPILRRVESDLVCVWIATSQRCNASLLLFDGADVVASDTPLGDLRADWVSDVQPTLQVGAHLHVLSITLDLRLAGGNAVRSSGSLLPDHPYSYDLNLFAANDPTMRQTLRTLGLLENPVPLGYDRGELPSFRTPPAERDKLVIVHGSCRQMFAVPPVGDDPALDEVPFQPPPGWPKAEPTIDSPAHEGDPIPFPDSEYPVLPKRDGMIWFALSYSDDWFLVPMALDAWTIFEATTVAVTDVFGDVTIANPPDGRWNLFRLDTTASPPGLSRIYLAAEPAQAMEGPALEEMHLLADAVANVAWAIERVVPQPLGRGRTVPEPPATARATTPSGLVWTSTPPAPPGNWFPLLPAAIGRLALGVLWSERDQRPAGRLLDELRASRQPLHQEEVPVEGAQVSRRVAVGASHRRFSALLDRPEQNPTPERHRASAPLRCRRIPVGRVHSE
jgi:hypothetical protein